MAPLKQAVQPMQRTRGAAAAVQTSGGDHEPPLREGAGSAVETSAAEGEKKLEPLDFEKLAGCAEVWRARAFVDEALLRVLVDAEA